VLISTSEDGGAPVAIGFRAKKLTASTGIFGFTGLNSASRDKSADEGDSITFSTPTIEGTVMRRNKPDGQGKHPWKAEVSEDDPGVSPETITGWYTEVYEPVFAVGGGSE